MVAMTALAFARACSPLDQNILQPFLGCRHLAGLHRRAAPAGARRNPLLLHSLARGAPLRAAVGSSIQSLLANKVLEDDLPLDRLPLANLLLKNAFHLGSHAAVNRVARRLRVVVGLVHLHQHAHFRLLQTRVVVALELLNTILGTLLRRHQIETLALLLIAELLLLSSPSLSFLLPLPFCAIHSLAQFAVLVR